MGMQPTTMPRCRRTGKRSYRTREGALASIITAPNLHVYKCPHCPHWHLTSRPRPDFDPRTDYPERYREGPI